MSIINHTLHLVSPPPPNAETRTTDNIVFTCTKLHKKRKPADVLQNSARRQKRKHSQHQARLAHQPLTQHRFNTKPTAEVLAQWQPEVCDQAHVLFSTLPAPTVVYEHIRDVGGGLCCVLDFIMAASCCTTWLESELNNIGWKSNITGFNPISASHSADEIIRATVECRNMAKKQMSVYLAVSDDRSGKRTVHAAVPQSKSVP
jgi:hypothetical protein